MRWLAVVFAMACATKQGEVPAASEPDAPVPEDPPAHRLFPPWVDGKPIQHGISYGPFREGHRPGGPNPSAEQILEDLKIVAQRWQMIRVYSSSEPTETILRTVRDNGLPLCVMVGAWIAPEDQASNEAQVAGAIKLANDYADVVCAVSVGNESQVSWSAHRSDRNQLIEYIKQVRTSVKQPVTTADDYNFWNKPEARAVADEVDFVLLHAYAMWNQQTLDNAISWTNDTYDSILAAHPTLPVVIGETGWATELNPEGNEREHIKAPAGEAEQAKFFEAFTGWATERGVAYFYFEAFDEPWKGSDDPREVEKHWGLYNVDRTPKQVLRQAVAGD